MIGAKNVIRRRSGRLAVSAAVLIIACLGGVFAGSKVTSRGAAAAHARPPKLSPLTEALENRLLVDDIAMRGTLHAGAGARVTAPSSLGGGDAVVTAVKVTPKTPLAEGTVISDIAGAPLISAVFPFPLYRDLALGDEGPDVQMLSEFLVRRGALGSPTDTVTTRFRSAVREVLTTLGYPDLIPMAASAPENVVPSAATSAIPPPPPSVPTAAPTATTDLPASLVLLRRWFARIDKPGRRIDQISIAVGSVLSADSLILLTDVAPPTVSLMLDHAAAGRLRVGDAASITDEASSRTVDARVSSVSATESLDSSGVSGYPAQLTPLRATELSGFKTDLLVSLHAAVSRTAALVAPISAVYTNASGDSHVTLANENSVTRDVTVTLGSCVGGWCQLRKTAEPLRVGERVVIGVPPDADS